MPGLIASQLISVLIAGFLAFLVHSLGTALQLHGSATLDGLSWLLPNAPALNEFIMFVLQTGLAALTVTTCALLHVSNHIVLTLDILYFLSISILFRYHRLQEDLIPRFEPMV